jgi:hypothetical protein
MGERSYEGDVEILIADGTLVGFPRALLWNDDAEGADRWHGQLWFADDRRTVTNVWQAQSQDGGRVRIRLHSGREGTAILTAGGFQSGRTEYHVRLRGEGPAPF